MKLKMANYIKSIKAKYLFAYCITYFAINLCIYENESKLDIILFLPHNILHFSLSSLLILAQTLFYVDNIMYYIHLENEIKIRIHNQYKNVIINRLFICYLLEVILNTLIFVFFYHIDIKIEALILLLTFIYIMIFTFLCIFMKKDTFKHIIIVNYLLSLFIRFAITSFLK